MPEFFKRFFTQNTGLKIMALVLALALWFYVVSELNKGSEEDRQFLNSVLPQGGLAGKQLAIRPILVGKPQRGYVVDGDRVLVTPEYCIVVGTKGLLSKIKFIYTLPVDISGSNKTFTKAVALNPIAPGIYLDETLVQVTVPVEKESRAG